MTLEDKLEKLKNFFRDRPGAAVAFSGGTDSALLLALALEAWREQRQTGAENAPEPPAAYAALTPFLAACERADMERIAGELEKGTDGLRSAEAPEKGADRTRIAGVLRFVEVPLLDTDAIRGNGPLRCYHCKKALMGALLKAAAQDGKGPLCDGSNATDDVGERPGMAALRELDIRSPFAECGITKAEIRALAKERGLSFWNKPSNGCLATRIPEGTPIEEADLARVDRGEQLLRGLGFTDFRLRQRGENGLLQLTEEDRPRYQALRDRVEASLKNDYKEVLLDPKAR